MKSSGTDLLRLLVDHDPASQEFRDGVKAVLAAPSDTTRDAKFDLKWVFVQQPLPWARFLQSVVLHASAGVLIWAFSMSLLREQKLLAKPAFEPSSLITYTPQEYLPPLDTGMPEKARPQKGDPVYAPQPVLSVPAEAENTSQTIVAPPNLKLQQDVQMPNMVSAGPVVPVVPLDATRVPLKRMASPDMQVVAPAPDVQFAPDRIVRAGLKSEVIAPPPELTSTSKGHLSQLDIGPSDVVAPAPQLTLEEQHSAAGQGRSLSQGGGVQPVSPAPSVASGRATSGGRLIALGIHPVAPSGPVAVPAGNRRGTFEANPSGKPGASGKPEIRGNERSTNGSKGGDAGVPAGLQVGAGKLGGRQVASLSAPRAITGNREGAVPEEKVTDLDRQVFGDKAFHSMALNMPNLNSATGSWVIHFAEKDSGKIEGQLIPPRSTEKADPGYPLELMRANVHGMVSLYAIIDAEGKVSSVRVLNSPDDRLDSYAAKALSLCKFRPAERAGKPVALEALIMIPFRAKRNF